MLAIIVLWHGAVSSAIASCFVWGDGCIRKSSIMVPPLELFSSKGGTIRGKGIRERIACK